MHQWSGWHEVDLTNCGICLVFDLGKPSIVMFLVCRVLCVWLKVEMDGIRYQNENPFENFEKGISRRGE